MKTPEELVYWFKTMNVKSKEPALLEGGLLSLIYLVGVIISGFIPADSAFMTNGTLKWVGTICFIVLPFILSFLIRTKVWSPASVAVLVKQLESMKAQEAHPLDNLARDFFAGEIKHNHHSFTDCTETCPRHHKYVTPDNEDPPFISGITG